MSVSSLVGMHDRFLPALSYNLTRYRCRQTELFSALSECILPQAKLLCDRRGLHGPWAKQWHTQDGANVVGLSLCCYTVTWSEKVLHARARNTYTHAHVHTHAPEETVFVCLFVWCTAHILRRDKRNKRFTCFNARSVEVVSSVNKISW